MIASVDGYKKGWLVVQSIGWPCLQTPVIRPCKTFSEVLNITRECSVIVVDMPIGLPDQRYRSCDELARRKLGTKAQSRVFYAPPRSTLAANDWEHFKQLHKQVQGRGLSKQVFGLYAKMAEVDCFMSPARQGRVREFHPELAWARLAGGTMSSKHTAVGILARMQLLRPFILNIDVLHTLYPEATASPKIDDLLDALIGLFVAASISAHTSPLRCLPETPLVDGKGLRMEIWF